MHKCFWKTGSGFLNSTFPTSSKFGTDQIQTISNHLATHRWHSRFSRMLKHCLECPLLSKRANRMLIWLTMEYQRCTSCVLIISLIPCRKFKFHFCKSFGPIFYMSTPSITIEKNFLYTVVPRIATLICSGLIVAIRKHCNAGGKTP